MKWLLTCWEDNSSACCPHGRWWKEDDAGGLKDSFRITEIGCNLGLKKTHATSIPTNSFGKYHTILPQKSGDEEGYESIRRA